MTASIEAIIKRRHASEKACGRTWLHYLLDYGRLCPVELSLFGPFPVCFRLDFFVLDYFRSWTLAYGFGFFSFGTWTGMNQYSSVMS